jgi:putative DNA primase/helicase
MSDIIATFRQAMSNAGIEPLSEIIADGALHRFTVAGDRARSDNGWYVLHTDDPAAGAFGCWKRGISEIWCSKVYQSMTQAEKTAYAAKMEAMKRQREEELKRKQAECRAWCVDTWKKAKEATNENPYLKRKGVNAFGLKSFNESLLVPVRNASGTFHGMQFIWPDGSKKFKTGTEFVGCYHAIGKPNGKILISEGYATGATLHEITGHAVAVAFNGGNLLSVAETLREKYPDIDIVICADDDRSTEGNPGLTKATEAAKAVNGLLAIPIFPDNRGSKDTDFNDLAMLEGPEVVRACIESAALPSESDLNNSSQFNPESQKKLLHNTLKRLAALSPLEYDQVRKIEANTLGVRPGTLDAEVKAARKGTNNEDLPFIEINPWPEPINPSKLLTDIALTIRRFIICDEEVSHAVSLWVAMTWFIDVVQIAPLAVITAPEKRCGKTLLLSLIGRLSARAITASNISPSALFRTIDAWNPTLLIDEVDAFMKDNEEFRGLLNSGHTRDSAYVIRNVGDNFTPTKFSTWGAKVLAGIGHVAGTLMDRAVIFELRRKMPHEKVERIRHTEPGLFDDLRSKLARFAEDFSQEVRMARPTLPDALNDRAQDNWEPLLAIAMTASDEWLKIGVDAALKLSGVESEPQSVGTELLADIQNIFKSKGVDRISLKDLVEALCDDEEKSWKTYNHGKSISSRQVSTRLAGYGIRSKTVRIGKETSKGYTLEQFAETFSRYLVYPPESPVTQSQSIRNKVLGVTEGTLYDSNKTEKVTPNILKLQGCYSVTEEKGNIDENIFSGDDFNNSRKNNYVAL